MHAPVDDITAIGQHDLYTKYILIITLILATYTPSSMGRRSHSRGHSMYMFRRHHQSTDSLFTCTLNSNTVSSSHYITIIVRILPTPPVRTSQRRRHPAVRRRWYRWSSRRCDDLVVRADAGGRRGR